MITNDEIETVICQRLGHVVGYEWHDLSQPNREEVARVVFARVCEIGGDDAMNLIVDAVGQCDGAPLYGYADIFNISHQSSINKYIANALSSDMQWAMTNLRAKGDE